MQSARQTLERVKELLSSLDPVKVLENIEIAKNCFDSIKDGVHEVLDLVQDVQIDVGKLVYTQQLEHQLQIKQMQQHAQEKEKVDRVERRRLLKKIKMMQ